MRKLAVVVLLACLAVGAWWTATPRTDQKEVGEAAAIYGDSRSNDLRIPWQTSEMVKDVGSGIGVVTLKSDLKLAGKMHGRKLGPVDSHGIDAYSAEVEATPWLNKVPTTLLFTGRPDVPLKKLERGTSWLVRVPKGGNEVTQAFQVTGNTVRLSDAAAELVTDDVDGGSKATFALDKLKSKIR